MRSPSASEQQLKRQALELWSQDRAQLLFRQPFLAALTLQTELVAVVDDRLRTACTDGDRIFVDARFLSTLSSEERVFLLAHEVWHAALGHRRRRVDRDPERWNVAGDAEVNALLIGAGLVPPEGAIVFPWATGLSAEQIYESLASLHPKPRSQARGGSQESAARALDPRGEHLPPEEELPLPEGVQDPCMDPDFRPLDLGSSPTPDQSVLRVKNAERRSGQQAGTLPSNVQSYVASTEPKVPWREVLRQFLTPTFGGERAWLPPSRRHIHRGLYLPSQRGRQLELAVALDTSGSMERVLPLLMGELRSLLTSFGRFRVQVFECDATIQRVRSFEDGLDGLEDLDSCSSYLLGGGGTDFRPVFEALQAEPDPPRALLYLTDGEGQAPHEPPGYPVLWVLTDRQSRPPAPWGATLVLDPSEADED